VALKRRDQRGVRGEGERRGSAVRRHRRGVSDAQLCLQLVGGIDRAGSERASRSEAPSPRPVARTRPPGHPGASLAGPERRPILRVAPHPWQAATLAHRLRLTGKARTSGTHRMPC
jgi:hypothetical protein